MSANNVGVATASTTDQFDTMPEVDFQSMLRSFGVIATLVHAERGIILEGVSRSFYGKQMAQELARKAKFVILSNRIRVDRTGN